MKKLTKSALILGALFFAASPVTLSAKCGDDGAKKEAPKSMKCAAGKCGGDKNMTKKVEKAAEKVEEKAKAPAAGKCGVGKCGGGK